MEDPSKDQLIENLKKSIEIKDEQINTIKESLALKDDQIKNLENILKIKEDNVQAIEKKLSIKEEKIKSLSESSVDASVLAEKEKKIKNLEEKMHLLKEELIKADEDLEVLELENQKLREGTIGSEGTKIIDFTNFKITRKEIIDFIRNILQSALRNVMIVVPTITDLQDLYLYEIRASVSMKISCSINPGIDEHSELLEEIESLDNISLRLYEREDRYVINRDGEELFLAVIGNDEDNHLIIHTKDSKHIQLLNSLVMESWLRARKI